MQAFQSERGYRPHQDNITQKRIDLYLELRKINPGAGFGRRYGKGQGMMGMEDAI
jgi:hypothetical protein